MTKSLAASLVTVGGLTITVLALARATHWTSVLVAAGIVLMGAGCAVLIATRRSPNATDVMRLNWFLPFLRKRSQAAGTRPTQWLRRVLKRLGPSVVSSPLRRLLQAGCLLLFLVLFYFVCWPYTAQPAPPGHESSGWKLAAIDQGSGALVFTHPHPPEWIAELAGAVHVVDESVPNAENSYVGAFQLTAKGTGQMALEPSGASGAEQFEQIVTSPGPWQLREHPPTVWPSHYADELKAKQFVPADIFLAIDPLVSLSTAIAARSWVWSLTAGAAILIVCMLIPRGFCGYICPLGTVIDLFDWSIGRRVTRIRIAGDGWWVHIKYYLLLGILFCSLFGVLISGFFAAIPVITRALLFITEPLQTGALRGWHLLPRMNAGHIVSVVLFLGVLCLGFLRPRFWCRYVCPSGALFSLSNLFRLTERKVESSCINCNKCVEICPFDAIKPDFTTRRSDCTFCQSCGGVCPTHAIKFVERWNQTDLKVENDPPTGDTSIGRRGFLSWAAGSTAAVAGGLGMIAACKSQDAAAETSSRALPVRPPGSVPEKKFLQLCIRCGECFKVCPNNVLQAEGFQQGLEGLWTPHVVADWAGCESSCNACGQVCPTGAIRELPLDEKRVARMGLAVVNEHTCLPFADREACQLCVDECNAAGYEAIEFMHVHTQVAADGLPLDGSGFLAPIVAADRCVGCGLCQTRCHGINVKTKGLLARSAIVIEAGPGKEDRLLSGSYVELRNVEAQERKQQDRAGGKTEFFLPESEASDQSDAAGDPDNPFGP